MKTKEDLRVDFYHETGDAWLNSQNEPDIDYVAWLENKILSNLHSAKEEVKSAEIDEIIDKIAPMPRLDNKENSMYLYSEVVLMMHEYASQFQSVQPWGESLNTDKRVITTTDNPDQFQKFSLLEESETITSADTIPIQSVKGEGEITANDELPLNMTIFNKVNQHKYSYDRFCEWFNPIREKLESYKHSESKDMWIPVKDKMPEGEVLLLTISNRVIIGDRYEGAWRTLLSEWVPNPNKMPSNIFKSAFKNEDITHWMPLPEHPKSK